MEVFLGIIIGLIVLTILVIIHELGHAIVALRSGVVVEEFGIGFPPRAWAKKLKNKILLSINWLPLGGFVRFKGEYDSADKAGDYGSVSYWQKTKILFAGVAMNWLAAFVIISGLTLFGLPKMIPNQFYIKSDAVVINDPVQLSSISDKLPAQKAGLKVGDEVIDFNGKVVGSTDELITLIKQNESKTIELTYRRNGQNKTIEIDLGTKTDNGILGAGLAQRQFIKSTWSAPIVGFVDTVQLTWATVQGLGDILYNLTTGFFGQFSPDTGTSTQAKQNLANVSQTTTGPIGIFTYLFPAATQSGSVQVFLLAAIISLNLAIMNILPIPALDGGRWFTMTVYRLSKKELTKETEESIQAIGFYVLMVLTLLVTIADVSKLF
ncbi:site-2 protease family protein [Candidatus Saccharibacteria bacterium]|nr:site-2 protease family protein [Candidatus Saccharibacteria bacterium]